MSDSYCILDIETTAGSFGDFPDSFELLFAGVKQGAEYSVYGADAPSLAGLADLLEGFRGTLVTFNGAAFDLPILRAYFRSVLQRKVRTRAHYDILQQVYRAAGRRISLAHLAQYNLGRTKLPWDHFQNKLVWSTTPELLVRYNRVDLDLTEGLYRLIREGRPLSLGDATVTLPCSR